MENPMDTQPQVLTYKFMEIEFSTNLRAPEYRGGPVPLLKACNGLPNSRTKLLIALEYI